MTSTDTGYELSFIASAMSDEVTPLIAFSLAGYIGVNISLFTLLKEIA